MNNATLVRDHEVIGSCSHAICVCAAHFHDPEGCINFTPKSKEPTMPIDQSIKDRAYLIDPECWKSYSGNAPRHKQRMDTRRTASLEQARKEIEEDGYAKIADAIRGEPKEEPMSQSLAVRVIGVVDEWLRKYGKGIPFIDRAELISNVTQVIEPPETPYVASKPALQAALEECAATDVGCGAAPAPVEKYCVIGLDAYQRTFHDTPEAAVNCADVMVRNNIERVRSGIPRPTKLLVVKVHSVVEKTPPLPPVTTVREPREADFIKHKFQGAYRSRTYP